MLMYISMDEEDGEEGDSDDDDEEDANGDGDVDMDDAKPEENKPRDPSDLSAFKMDEYDDEESTGVGK